jgi:hypothetical protein
MENTMNRVVDVVAFLAPAVFIVFLVYDIATHQTHLAIDVIGLGGWLSYVYERRDSTILKLRLLKLINEVAKKHNA